MTDLRAEEIREELDEHANDGTCSGLLAVVRKYLASLEQEPDIEVIYEAAFRKADELGWEGEEQFMGELIEIVDAALTGFRSQPKGDNK